MSEPCHQEMEKTAGHLDPFECLFYQNGHGICHFHFVLLSNTDCRRAFLEAKAAAAAVRSQQEEKQAATPGSQSIIHPSAREQFPSHLKPAGKLGLQSWVGRGGFCVSRLLGTDRCLTFSHGHCQRVFALGCRNPLLLVLHMDSQSVCSGGLLGALGVVKSCSLRCPFSLGQPAHRLIMFAVFISLLL